MFKNAKRMAKISQHIIGERYIRNDGIMAVSDEDKKTAWNSYHEKLLNAEFAWDTNSLS